MPHPRIRAPLSQAMNWKEGLGEGLRWMGGRRRPEGLQNIVPVDLETSPSPRPSFQFMAWERGARMRG